MKSAQIAVVTGASRGAGKGIAVVLGEQGATVYCTGRSTRGGRLTEGLPGTVEDTAEEVTARGGRGIPVVCDHTDDGQVKALFDRVQREQGGLDLLVNNVWGGYEGHPAGLSMEPFWKQDPAQYHAMFGAGVRPHLVASALAAPLLIQRGRGLIVNTVAWLDGKYLRNIYYDLSKATLVRMTLGMAEDLRPHDVAAIAVAPGFIRSERVMAAHASHPFPLDRTESPEYIGRAVAALVADPAVMARSGSILYVGNLAREYGFTDIDGRYVPVFTV